MGKLSFLLAGLLGATFIQCAPADSKTTDTEKITVSVNSIKPALHKRIECVCVFIGHHGLAFT